MSVPHPHKPGQSSVGRGQFILIVCGVLGFTALFCCGALGLLGAIFYTRTEQTLAEVQQSIPNLPTSMPRWQDDWGAMQALTGIYITVVDAAVKDPRVIERLGEPIETVDSESALFRRDRSGSLAGEEKFEFDLQGPKGKATIKVECSTKVLPGMHQAAKVIARFEDGSELELPMPEVKPR